MYNNNSKDAGAVDEFHFTMQVQNILKISKLIDDFEKKTQRP